MAEDPVGLGKIAESIERVTREVRELAKEFLSPIGKEVGEYLADRVRFARAAAARRALEMARDQVAASGIQQIPVSPKILASTLEGASLEEDDDLVSRWAGLIATAATTGETLPAFSDILRQLTAKEAQMLDHIYSATPGDPANSVDAQRFRKDSGLDIERFLVLMENLSRLGLVYKTASWTDFATVPPEGWNLAREIALTSLGQAFVRACRGPSKLVS